MSERRRAVASPDEELASTQHLGAALIDPLHDLAARVPRLRAAMIVTDDGLNVCSLGVDDDAVAGLAALCGSLVALGAATAREFAGDGQASCDAESVIVTAGSTLIIATTIDEPVVAPLVLVVAVSGPTTGVMQHHVQHTVELIRQRLRDA